MNPEPFVDLDHDGMEIHVRHLRHADGELFAFNYSITSPTWGEVKSDACYECGETFEEFVESCKRIADAIVMDPYAWLDDDWFDDCERCDSNGSIRDIHGDIVACGHCRGRGRILQK